MTTIFPCPDAVTVTMTDKSKTSSFRYLSFPSPPYRQSFVVAEFRPITFVWRRCDAVLSSTRPLVLALLPLLLQKGPYIRIAME